MRGRASRCVLPARRSRCWLFWGHSTCSEVPALCTLHVCMALAGAMMTGGVLDLIFWVLDPFGWKNEG